jgi:cytochrome c oxidase assembly protein subunit 11
MTATGLLQLENRRLLTKLLVVATAMFGFGFALVPFYEKICQVTGIRNLLRADHVAIANTQVDTTRKVTVEFDSNTHKLAWGFKPTAHSLELHPGEIGQMVYEIRNDSDHAITGQAIPSYSPALAAQHFRKIECFCFTQQTLRAGEVRRMPVSFVVDSELPKSVGTITLSFTFFEVNGGGANDRVGG